jgi:hypothetical protein
VTRTRAGNTSGETYRPNHALIKRYSDTYNWIQEKLEAVLSKFGPLPETGQEQLIRLLIRAFVDYQFVAKTIERVTPSQQRNQLKQVEHATQRLLRHLKSDFVRMSLASAGIQTAGRTGEWEAINSDLRMGVDRVIDIVRALEDLFDRTRKAEQIETARIKSGHGGARRRPSGRGQLIAAATEIYSDMRSQYPESGRQPGLGGPLVKFVQAVGHLCGVSFRDSEIKDVCRGRKSKQKES